MEEELKQQNDKLVQTLSDRGRKDIKQRLKTFQVKYISNKIKELLP
jgi:hypothetical protein